MSEPDHDRAGEIFLSACELTGDERAALLDRACAGDEALRAAVDRLLAHDKAPHALLRSGQVFVLPVAVETSGRTLLELRLESAGPLLPRGARLDEFEIVHEIGQGGMGVVYRAVDTELGREVALKVLSPRFPGSTAGLERFQREAKAVAALHHPGIIEVYRVGHAMRLHYMAMELVDGGTLSSAIDDLRLLPESEREAKIRTAHYWQGRARMLADIADALEHAHARQIIHRDVKPSNILLEEASGRARLADFGLAKMLEGDDLTESGGQPGTPYYMSPEQVVRASTGLDRRTDIFSLGVVLYEVLTLQRPFDGDTNHDVFRKVVSLDPRRVRTINPAVSGDLEWIVHTALEKDPAHRFQRAALLAAALRLSAAGEPLPFRRPSRARRAWRWMRRHPVRAAFALVFLLATTVVALGIYGIARYRAAMWTLVVLEPSGAQVYLQQFDDPTLALGAPRLIGVVPVRERRVDPGLYRVTLTQQNGAFAEVTEVLEPPRGVRVVDAPIPSFEEITEITEDMVLVPAGEYSFGWSQVKGELLEARKIRLDKFYIDAAEVTNAEYLEFVKATGHSKPLHWELFEYDEDLADHPVVNITPRDADLYARWKGKRLPTVFEWECAARFPDGRLYPWGNGPPPADDEPPEGAVHVEAKELEIRYRAYRTGTRPVPSRPELRSELGLYETFGNVKEITSSVNFTLGGWPRIIKGRSWDEPITGHIDLARTLHTPNKFNMRTGFRCARSASAPVGNPEYESAMTLHVTIQGTFRPITSEFTGLTADQFETVRNALRCVQTSLITPELEANWQDLQADGGSILGGLDSAYDVVRSQLTPPSADDELVITVPGSEEWLDLGQQGHEFAKPLFLKSKQSGIQRAWKISVDVLGIFQAHLFITGRITTDEAGPSP
ncbi:MAG: bifunctional serine/threonine-protein kinase/formylglycine-generating enzyme family protein [Phycisphaerales bacterium]